MYHLAYESNISKSTYITTAAEVIQVICLINILLFDLHNLLKTRCFKGEHEKNGMVIISSAHGRTAFFTFESSFK